MKQILLVAGALAVMSGSGTILQAQRGETPKPSTATATVQGTAHLEGCVFPKRALTEKQPVTVPEGKVEDYVLSDTKVVALAEGTVVAPGTIFALQQADAARLRQFIGQWVGVTGRIESKPDMPVLQVISIRDTTGSFCPAVPTPKP